MPPWRAKIPAWSLRSARITSKPLIVAYAVFSVLNPRTGRINSLSLPWSASMTLLRYFTCLCLASVGHFPSAFSSAMAAA